MVGILRIKDAEGNWHSIEAIKGEPGKNGTDYILTENDKEEIANLIPVPEVELDNYYTKEQIDEMLANLPVGETLEACEGVIF